MGNWAYVIRVPNTKYGGAAGQSAPKGTARVMMRSPTSISNVYDSIFGRHSVRSLRVGEPTG